jgi:hypothetical protein
MQIRPSIVQALPSSLPTTCPRHCRHLPTRQIQHAQFPCLNKNTDVASHSTHNRNSLMPLCRKQSTPTIEHKTLIKALNINALAHHNTYLEPFYNFSTYSDQRNKMYEQGKIQRTWAPTKLQKAKAVNCPLQTPFSSTWPMLSCMEAISLEVINLLVDELQFTIVNKVHLHFRAPY